MAAKSAVKPIPEGFHTVTPYLIVEQANRLIDFLTQGVGAEEVSRAQGPDGTICNAQVRIGDSMLELADRTEQWKPRLGAIHLYVPDTDATYQRAMAVGGVSLEVPTDQSYGDREAGVKDPSGNPVDRNPQGRRPGQLCPRWTPQNHPLSTRQGSSADDRIPQEGF